MLARIDGGTTAARTPPNVSLARRETPSLRVPSAHSDLKDGLPFGSVRWGLAGLFGELARRSGYNLLEVSNGLSVVSGV